MSEFAPLDQFFAKRVLKEAYTNERACFLSHLMAESRKGHLCVYESNPPNLPDSILQKACSEPQKPIIYDQNRYYLNKNWVFETFLIERIRELRKPDPLSIQIDFSIFSNLLPKQKEAVKAALNYRFSIFSGGPGTGKTYTAATLVKALIQASEKPLEIYLTAPTGRAASHLQSIIGSESIKAMTLHRLLKVQPQKMLPPGKLLDADFIIVDEASMLDVSMMVMLFEAIGKNTRVLLMGDPDQLPPVDAGSLFKELSDLFGSQLERSMRVRNHALAICADQVNRGEIPSPEHFIDLPFDHSLFKSLVQKLGPVLFDEKPDPQICLQNLSHFRILSLLKQGPFGTEKLNREILIEFRLQIRPSQWWVIPIMITKNTPELNLYNGTAGVLIGRSSKGIDLSDGVAYFPEEIQFRDLPSFEVSFCLSIHKSQGSEFDSVIAIFPKGSESFGKEALYTAVTRSKSHLSILAEKQTLEKMLKQKSTRDSGFKERFLLKKS